MSVSRRNRSSIKSLGDCRRPAGCAERREAKRKLLFETLEDRRLLASTILQTYFIPLPETQVRQSFVALQGASQDGTTLSIDKNADGTPDITGVVLNQGAVYFVDGGVSAGATVTASNPVQVDMVTGDKNDPALGTKGSAAQYESRTFALFPTAQLFNSYWNPVTTTKSAAPGIVWLHNPTANSITINYQTMAGSGTLTVAAHQTRSFTMPLNSAARFYTADTADVFSAVYTNDASQTSDSNTAWDWGMTLQPGNSLTTSVSVGYGPGSADLSANGSPVWFTTNKDGTVYVDNDGNPATGAFTDPVGNKYDQKFTVTALQATRVFDTSDKNQTGMRLYSLDNTVIAAAWGEDPSTAGSGNPYLDMGFAIMPLPVYRVSKTAALAVDRDGNGVISVGDDVRFTILIENVSLTVLTGVVVNDPLPANVTYVSGSTDVNGLGVADNTTPGTTPYPLDETGLPISDLAVGVSSTAHFTVRVNPLPSGVTTVANTAGVTTNNAGSRAASANVPVAPSPPPTLDLDGSTAGSNYSGCFQANGVLVPVTGTSVVITDPGPTIASAVVKLASRPDGTAEALVIDQALANSLRIGVTSDGAGGFTLAGTATLANYQSLLATLKYTNTLSNPTLLSRVIQVTLNDGAANSNTATATLNPPATIAFTNALGGTATTAYPVNGTVYVGVNNQAANASSTAIDTVNVTLESPTDKLNTPAGNPANTLMLSETGLNTGIFIGSFQTSTTAGVNNTNILNALAGATITVSAAGSCNVATAAAVMQDVTIHQKPLYLSPVVAPFTPQTQGLDRVDPVATSDTSTSSVALGGISTTVIGQDNTAAQAIGNVKNLSFSYTVNAATTQNTLMLVGISTGNASVSSLTYNGVSLTRVGTRAGTNARVEIWQLKAPAQGSHTLALGLSAASNGTIGVVSFTGVDQTTPLGTAVGRSRTSRRSASVTVASATGQIVFDTIAWTNNTSLTKGATQTLAWNVNGNNPAGGASTKAGASSVTMSWTAANSGNYALLAVPIRPAAGVANPTSATFT